MVLFKEATAITDYLHKAMSSGLSAGFVPTMGALHDGHLSLLSHARAENDITVCSIFVNPTQFNNPEDLKHYPRTIETDIEKLVGRNCDVLFLPSVDEIYPPGYTARKYDLGLLESRLEGAHRPGHFQGVCAVVDRLLNIVHPTRLYLGQKDLQQCLVIERLLEIMPPNDIELKIVPTYREPDGLAMSSRNLRLSKEQRQLANGIYTTLMELKMSWSLKRREDLERQAEESLSSKGFSVDYVSVVNANNLDKPSEGDKLVAVAAASTGDIRLIDNLFIN